MHRDDQIMEVETSGNKSISLVVFRDDPSTPEQDGLIPVEPILIIRNRHSSDEKNLITPERDLSQPEHDGLFVITEYLLSSDCNF